jgi:hypothetical protein
LAISPEIYFWAGMEASKEPSVAENALPLLPLSLASTQMPPQQPDGIRKIWNKVTQTKHTVGIGKNTLANAALWIFGLLS